MCGRFYFSKPELQVKSGELCPGDFAQVFASNRARVPHPFAMHWGYKLPSGKLVFNARSETLLEKPMFRDGITSRRCMIPAECYFEWSEGKKYAISAEGADIFLLAGIYRISNGAPEFTILTKAPAESISFIHDRMPVVLPESLKQDWLNPEFRGIELLKEAINSVSYRIP